MRVLVCGGRDYADEATLFHVLSTYMHPITHLIHGGARGADTLAARYALTLDIPCTCYPANWAKHGKGAGPLRNQRMLDEGKPDRVVAFPGGAGTADMVRRAERAGVKILRVVYPPFSACCGSSG